MTCSCTLCDDSPCGCAACDCCKGTEPATPEAITNRPALSQVSYRAGRYVTFLASMLAALSSADPTLVPLAALRTRDPSDFSIALLDSWALTLDILTFYSERVANEAFLRTAVEQRSVIELAALVGYMPSPGVAASATLAFTLSTAPGSPATVPIPAGTRVQSIPGPGQTAQVFETSADLTAVAAWNALPAQTTAQWRLTGNEQSTWIAGTSTGISVGDALLFVAATGGQSDVTGQQPLELHYVTAVTTDPVAKATQLTWETPLSSHKSTLAGGAVIYTFRKKAALFGANAPSPALLSGTNISYVPGWPSGPGVNMITTPDWDYKYGGDSQLSLDAVYPGLTPATSGPPPWLVLTTDVPIGSLLPELGLSNPQDLITGVFTIASATDSNPSQYALTSRATTLTLVTPPRRC